MRSHSPSNNFPELRLESASNRFGIFSVMSLSLSMMLTRHKKCVSCLVTRANSPALSEAKAVYYRLFAFFYGAAGRCSSVIMVNSSWTLGHVSRVWKCPHRILRVFPPCDTASLQVRLGAPFHLANSIVVAICSFVPTSFLSGAKCGLI